MTPLRRTARRADPSSGDDDAGRRGADMRGGAPRTGAKRSLLGVIRRLPDYLRMLAGLMRDARVSRLDRGLVLAAAAYIVLPFDFLPDFIPFLGEVDDVFLLVLALRRLVERAGRAVLLDHWRGDPAALSDLTFSRVLAAAAFFLPASITRRLRRLLAST
ncbi:MAG: YkvA family protein [Gemmatimonadota bacterium]